MRGSGHHEPWGDESRRQQLRRVLVGLTVVLVVAVVVVLVVQLVG
ncbi:hypothetical protein [Cellulomonas dongxiuzhuiae]|nr:hypothetical protein [Cellulomonas dongxiuzhuiae]